MLLKCCTQYVSKFRKLFSGHRTGSHQFSFQSQRRVMSKSFKLGFSRWFKNFQSTRWISKRQRNQRSNCQRSLDHGKSKGVPEKHLFLLHWLWYRLTVWITTKCGKLLEMGVPDHFICLPRNLYAGQEATVKTRQGTMDWFLAGKGVWQGYIMSSYLTKCTVHHAKCQTGWSTRWNQDCQKKYQQPQIWRWYHSDGRKWRGTKEPLDEGERRDWKSWPETQH